MRGRSGRMQLKAKGTRLKGTVFSCLHDRLLGPSAVRARCILGTLDLSRDAPTLGYRRSSLRVYCLRVFPGLPSFHVPVCPRRSRPSLPARVPICHCPHGLFRVLLRSSPAAHGLVSCYPRVPRGLSSPLLSGLLTLLSQSALVRSCPCARVASPVFPLHAPAWLPTSSVQRFLPRLG